MIQVLARTLETGDEANARHLFDVFETLLILVRDKPVSTLPMPKVFVGDSSAKSAHPSAGSVLHTSWLQSQYRCRVTYPCAQCA